MLPTTTPVRLHPRSIPAKATIQIYSRQSTEDERNETSSKKKLTDLQLCTHFFFVFTFDPSNSCLTTSATSIFLPRPSLDTLSPTGETRSFRQGVRKDQDQQLLASEPGQREVHGDRTSTSQSGSISSVPTLFVPTLLPITTSGPRHTIVSKNNDEHYGGGNAGRRLQIKSSGFGIDRELQLRGS